jgi:reactive chlorine resistance protein C
LDDTVLSVRGVSNLIGVIEIAIAILLALRSISAKASFVGSLGSVVTFLLTTSFLLSTPGAVQLNHGLPVLGDAGQFLIKDVVLLGASFWTAAEALAAIYRSKGWPRPSSLDNRGTISVARIVLSELLAPVFPL